jgi:hypothetical protein
MYWFRSHKLKLASLALLALACQFVFSFGHIHLHPLASKRSNWVHTAVAAAEVAQRATLAEVPAGSGRTDPGSLGDGFCAICASISLAGAAVISNAPNLPFDILFIEQLDLPFVAAPAQLVDLFHFEARGPPAV